VTERVYVEPIKAIRDIIQHEMVLDDTQIIIFNQKYNIPKFEGIFIALGVVEEKFAIVKTWFDHITTTEWFEGQVVTSIQVDIMSRNEESRLRRFEAFVCLHGIYGQNMVEANMMKIARMPTAFVSLDDTEDVARINRYSFSININSLYSQSKTGIYYDQFEEPPLLADKSPAR